MEIQKIIPRMILDSRGFPTVECDLYLRGIESFGRASVPSGASVGKKEALELRDCEKNRYNGKGVDKALFNIKNKIAPIIIGKNFNNFKELDKFLCEIDDSKNKSNLGANSILAVSLAFAKALSIAHNIPTYALIQKEYGINNIKLPKPMFNVINGGAHADNNLDIQEFMVMPQFEDYRDNLRAGCEIVYSLKNVLKDLGYATNVGDEGGFAPQLKSNTHALDLISKAIENTSYKLGEEIKICLDIAASELFTSQSVQNINDTKKRYLFEHENKEMNADELIEFYLKLCTKYPIFSIEDAMAEDDFEGWKKCTRTLYNSDSNSKIQLVGDDLFVTNPTIFKKLSAAKLANAILIKPNQVGTLTEALDVIEHAKKIGYQTVISHRSGETEDTTIAHIAYGMDAGQIKTGAPVRTDRNAKFNELLRFV